jgi:membrane associated rhomboid family serine protease
VGYRFIPNGCHLSTLAKQCLIDFREVFLAFILFATFNAIIFTAIYFQPNLFELLRFSPKRPWTIVTSAFTHKGLDHFIGNILGFLVSCLIFIITNWWHDPRTKRFSSKVFLLVFLLSGFLTDTIVFLKWGETGTYGASGVVYASIGTLLPSGIGYLPGLRKPFSISREKLAKLAVVLLILTYLLWLVCHPHDFLNFDPEVNVHAHACGFLLGFFVFSLVFFLIRPRVLRDGVRLTTPNC